MGKYILEVVAKGMYMYLRIDISSTVRVTVSNTEPEDFSYYEYVKTIDVTPFTVTVYKFKEEAVEETIIDEERRKHPPEDVIFEKTTQ